MFSQVSNCLDGLIMLLDSQIIFIQKPGQFMQLNN